MGCRRARGQGDGDRVRGREGEGKSLLAMALGAGVATGQDEAGFTCHRGGVVIVDAENGAYEIHRRVHTLELPGEGIHVYEAEGFDPAHAPGRA